MKKNLYYAIMSNGISILISILVVLIIPKIISVEEYSYWQLYIFYSSFVGFLHFGWSDGVYLRYGGQKFENLNRKIFASQFYYMLLLQFSLSIVGFGFLELLEINNDKKFVFYMLMINLFITNVTSLILLTLQTTNEIKKFSLLTIINRLIYFFVVSILLFCDIADFKLLIISDLIGKMISLFLSVYYFRGFIIKNFDSFSNSFAETKANISVGSKLMFANIANLLIIGIVRFGIEINLGLEKFGKVSLLLSIVSMVMIFLSSISIVMFPLLKRSQEIQLPKIYLSIRNVLDPLLFTLLLLYFPLYNLILLWLTEYKEILKYVGIFLPMIVFEAKIIILTNTFFKVLRKEQIIMSINLFILIISIFGTVITTYLFESLTMAISLILILTMFRCIISEVVLAKTMKIPYKLAISNELIVVTLFLLIVSFFDDSRYSVLAYTIVLFIYMYFNKKGIYNSLIYFKKYY